MPFEPASNPDLAGEFMSNGINLAGSGMAAGLNQALEGMQQKTKERKAYLGMAGVMKTQGLIDDHTYEALLNAPTETVKGTIDGLKTAATLKTIGFNNDLLRQHIEQANAERGQLAGLNQDLSKSADANDNPALEKYYENPEQYPGGRPEGELDVHTMLRAAARHHLLGNANVDRFIGAMERVEARRAEKAGADTTPRGVTVKLSDGRDVQVIHSPGSHGFSFAPPDTEGGMAAIPVLDGEGNVLSWRVPQGQGTAALPVAKSNQAGEDKLSAETEAILHKSLESYNEQMRVFDTNAERVRTGEKRADGSPYTLMDQKQRSIIRSLRDKVQQRLLGPVESAPAKAPAVQRSTEIEPSIGYIKVGRGNVKYRYIGGYGTLDKRSWQPVP